MKRYEKYKDSGIEWLGEIPEHWSTCKIKHIASLKSGDFISAEEIHPEGTFPVLGGNGLRGFTSKFNIEGEHLLIGRQGALCGNINYGRNKFWATEHAIVAYPIKTVSTFYVGELLRHMNLNQYSESAAQPGISVGKISNLQIPLVPFSEQTAIAAFLDYKTTQIDALIEKKEQLIDKLKLQRQAIINEAVTKGLNPNAPMKDSGIEWLGEIPAHWEVVKLKSISEAFGRIGYRGYTTEDIVFKGEGAITISPSNIHENEMEFSDSTYISWEKYEESPEIQIFNDDVLMVKTGSTYGKVGIVKNLNEKATINPQLLVLKNIKINPDYLFQVLRTPLIKGQVETDVIGSTIPTISQTKILNFSLVVPPENEIQEILFYINRKTETIDTSVSKIIDSIDKLKLYRQSLISEAVTGKIDVRDWELTKTN